tara:strand:- start:25 stop:192 length:168 start_codon:yes stop_codon:yes gene_type:complete
MATIGGLLTFIAVYGFYAILVLSFFFSPNAVTLLFMCVGVYMFSMGRINNGKEKD